MKSKGIIFAYILLIILLVGLNYLNASYEAMIEDYEELCSDYYNKDGGSYYTHPGRKILDAIQRGDLERNQRSLTSKGIELLIEYSKIYNIDIPYGYQRYVAEFDLKYPPPEKPILLKYFDEIRITLVSISIVLIVAILIMTVKNRRFIHFKQITIAYLFVFITFAIFLTPYRITRPHKGVKILESRGFLPIFSLPSHPNRLFTTHIDLTILLIFFLVSTVIWMGSYFILKNNSTEEEVNDLAE